MTNAGARCGAGAGWPRASRHPRRAVRFWHTLVESVIGQEASTPFYVFSTEPVAEALGELRVLERAVPVPVRHWLPCKAQPLPSLLEWWRRADRPVESARDLMWALLTSAEFLTMP